ncbi:MAG: glycine cleavage T C-terminal barrel domain-containing protein, partial [Natronospirillum sp.]
GPSAEAVLATLNPKVREMVFMDNWPLVLDGNACFVSRSGYTGEDGFEISVPAAAADSLARRLLAHEDVAPIGLGARDSLRLEAGLCLYGHDIDANTTPPEAGLVWAIPKARRTGGERAGGFPGADVILPQIQNRNWARKRVGLVGADRVPVREGAALFNADNEPVGQVTSGTFSPSLGVPIAMGYVQAGYEVVDTVVAAEVRGRRIPLVVTRLPLVEQRYLR